MRVLITRPREEAEALAAELVARGFECLVEPLLDIRPAAAAAMPLEGVQALLFTSANGVRAYAAREGRRDLPVFAVGDRTADVARGLGFAKIESAQGALPELAELVRTRLDPAKGALLHAAGATVKGDLKALLEPHGFTLRRVVLYEAVPATFLSPRSLTALREGTLDAVLLFSPRSAEVLVGLVRAAGVAGACARLAAFCLSPAVAEAARALAWRSLAIAERPEQAALLALLARQREGAAADGEKAAGRESPMAYALGVFGGLRPMAAKLGLPVTTVQGWKERGQIPEARIAEVIATARGQGIQLEEAALRAAPGSPSPAPEPAAAPTAAAPASAAPAAPKPAAASVPPSAAAKPEAGPAAAPPSPPRVSAEAKPRESPRPLLERRLAIGIIAGLGVASLAILALAAALSLPYWGPALGLRAGAPPSNAADPALAARLASLEKRLAAITGAPSAPAAPAGDTKPLADALASQQERLAGLEKKLDALAARPDSGAAESSRVAALGQELAAVKDSQASIGDRLGALSQRADALAAQLAPLKDEESRLAAQSGSSQQRLSAVEDTLRRYDAADPRAASLVLAVGQLREALARSAPYARALDGVAALAGDDARLAPPLAALKPRADTGVATRAELVARFDAVSLAAARAAMRPAHPGWLGDVLARLSRLVVVRRTDDGAGEGPLSALARAEARLKDGDLAAAVGALATLEDGPAEAVKDWLAEARARLAAEDALARLSAEAVARLGRSRS